MKMFLFLIFARNIEICLDVSRYVFKHPQNVLITIKYLEISVNGREMFVFLLKYFIWDLDLWMQ